LYRRNSAPEDGATPQPAESPDLSPCDLWFFVFAKQAIQDEVFDNADQLMQRLHSIFDQITFEDL
jgi:hypothetical protein